MGGIRASKTKCGRLYHGTSAFVTSFGTRMAAHAVSDHEVPHNLDCTERPVPGEKERRRRNASLGMKLWVSGRALDGHVQGLGFQAQYK